MKLAIFLLPLLFFLQTDGCGDDDSVVVVEDPPFTEELVTFNNNRGSTGGCYPEYSVEFLVTYRDIQASVNLPSGGTGFLTLLVEDGESVNVKVIKESDDSIVANASVDVRTTSRPQNLENQARTVNFCESFDLQFSAF